MTKNSRNKTGSKNLSLDVIRKIKNAYKIYKVTQKQIAEEFNLSQSTVSKIINNKIHKKVTEISMGGSADVIFKVKHKYGN